MVSDPISDMFNQIVNAQAVGKPVVWLSYSRMKFNLAKILKERHYLREVKKRGLGAQARLGLGLRYFENQPEDEFKGAYAPTADIIMLNGLKTPKAKITVEAYENADGEAALTHSVRILLNSQDVAELERKALKYGKQVQAQPIAANPFE